MKQLLGRDLKAHPLPLEIFEDWDAKVMHIRATPRWFSRSI